MPPKINDEWFFAAIDPAVAALALRPKPGELPWEGVAEDREVVHDALTKMYADRQLPRPKFCWARSPFSMFGAIQYLRRMQTEQRQEVIKGMVVGGEPLEAETRAVFLESVMDVNLTVTMGACLRDSMFPKPGGAPKAIKQLARVMQSQFTPTPNGKPQPAGWRDWIVYPLEHPFNYALLSQTLCICPFMRMVWISRPPVFVRTDDEGNLHCEDGPAARFADGFVVYARHVPEDVVLRMNAPTKRPNGQSALEMLCEAQKQLPAPKGDSDAS